MMPTMARFARLAAAAMILTALAQPGAAQPAAAQPAAAQPAAAQPATGGQAAAGPETGQQGAQDTKAANSAAPPAAPPPQPFTSSGPFSFSAALTADLLADAAGGQTRGVKLLTKTNVSASYDGGASNGGILGPGWTGQASIQYVKGGHISADNVGDIQGVDNIEAFNALRLYEAWLERQWAGGKYGVKFGLTDLNVDFDTQQVAALFINSSDGIGAEFSHSGLNGPSVFPTTTLGLTGFVKPGDPWTLRAGVLNGLAGSDRHPSDFFALHVSARTGALLVFQAEHAGASGLRTYLGGWAYTADFAALHLVDSQGNPLSAARMRGAYALAEGQIAGGDGRSLAGWVRAGLGDPVVERISGYVGFGLVATGLIKGRAEDQSGISVNHAIVDQPGLPPGASPAKRAETAIEVTYRVQAKDWLAVQPDLQYVHRPNGDPAIASALVVGLRLSVSLTHNLVEQIKGGL